MALNNDTTLYGYGHPTINKVDAERVLSATILENIYLGLVEHNEKGITEKFSRNTSGATIRIPHFKPLGVRARQLGASKNGGNFPTEAKETESQSFEVPVLFVLDQPIDVAEVSKDIATIDILDKAIKNWVDESKVEINAMTIAGKLFATYEAKADGKEVNEVVASDWSTAILEANALLDEGAVDMGIYSFPQEGRVAVIKSKYRPALLKNGVLVLGGANLGYQIQEKGTLSAGAAPRKLEDGYIGEIDGVDVHQVPSSIFNRAAEWLGLGTGDLDNVYGYVSSSEANVRAIASPYDCVIDNHPTGRGWRIKPLLRAGFKTIEGYEKGNVFLVAKTGVNPFEAVKTLGGEVEFVPYGSRNVLGLTLSSSAATKITATVDGTAVKLLAKFGSFSAVSDFAAETTELTSGVEATMTAATKGAVVSVLALASDGTATIEKITIGA